MRLEGNGFIDLLPRKTKNEKKERPLARSGRKLCATKAQLTFYVATTSASSHSRHLSQEAWHVVHASGLDFQGSSHPPGSIYIRNVHQCDVVKFTAGVHHPWPWP